MSENQKGDKNPNRNDRGDRNKDRAKKGKQANAGRRSGEAPPVKADEVLGVRDLILRPDKTSNYMDWKREIQEYAYRHFLELGDIVKDEKHHVFPLPEADIQWMLRAESMEEQLKMQEDELEEGKKDLLKLQIDIERLTAAIEEGNRETPPQSTTKAAKTLESKKAYEARLSTNVNEKKIKLQMGKRQLDANKAMWQERDKNAMRSYQKLVDTYDRNMRYFYGVMWATLSKNSQDHVEQEPTFASIDSEKDPLKLFMLIKKVHLLPAGGNSSNAILQRMREYTNIRQRAHDEPLRDYLLRFRHALEGYTLAGFGEPSEEVQVVQFIRGLDQSKYAEMQRSMYNDSLGNASAYPKTLQAAMTIAQQYLIPKKSGGGNIVAAFATTTREQNDKKKKKVKSKGNNTGGRAEEKGSEEKEDGNAKPSEPICFGCGQRGHIKRNCPNKSKGNQQQTVAITRTLPTDDDDWGGPNSFGFQICNTSRRSKRTPSLHKNTVLLDNEASSSIFNNRRLLTDITEEPEPMHFSGIGGGIIATETGRFGPYGRVWIAEDATANILSWSEMRDRLQGKLKLEYDDEEDVFRARFKTGRCDTFSRDKKAIGLYSKEFVLLTETERTSMLPIQDIEKAKAAKDLWERVGPVGEEQIKILTQRAGKQRISPKDVANSRELYGPHLGIIKGKATEPEPVKSRGERLMEATNQELVMHSDLMIISGQVFLVSRLKPIGLAMTTFLGRGESSKNAKSIGDGLRGQIATAAGYNFIVKRVLFDGEKGVDTLTNMLFSMGVVLEARPGQHVPAAEALIKQIKGFCRGIITTLPWNLPQDLIPDLVKFASQRLNILETKSGMFGVPPIEAFTGIPVDVDLEAKHKFGQYVQAITPNVTYKNDVMKTRSVGGIVVGQKGRDGTVLVRSLASKKIITRSKVIPLPTPPEVVEIMNNWAAGKLAEFDGDEPDPDNIPGPRVHNPEPIENVLEARPQLAAGTVDFVDDVEKIDIERDTDNDAEVEDVEEYLNDESNDKDISDEILEDMTSNALDNNISESQIDQAEVNQTIPDATLRGDEPTRRSARLESRERVNYKQLSMHTIIMDVEENQVYKLTVKKGIELYGDMAEEAIAAELRQIHEKGAFTPILWNDLSDREKAGSIRCFMFLKEKYNDDGSLEKIKARLVANGKMQDMYIYDDNYSPTVSLTTVYLLVGLAAKNGWAVGIGDITGAYLNADMPSDGKPVVMILDNIMSDLLIKVCKRYSTYRRSDGKVVVKLSKALYGCVESAKLWYLNINNYLKSIGFQTDDGIDKCLFINKERDISLAVYVDDILAISSKRENIEWLFRELEKNYGKMKVIIGEETFTYVGMEFNFSEKGSCKISMNRYTRGILDEWQCGGMAEYPAAKNLFEAGDDTKMTEECQQDFHSLLAKLLYLAKRVEPALLTAISYLSTRVKKANISDGKKLIRLLSYLRSKGCKGIILKMSGKRGVVAFIDASFACHQDYKSHNGIIIFVWGAPVYFASAKQKTIAKSSFEAEVNAVTDGLSIVIHVNNLLTFVVGSGVDVPVVMQDNLGAVSALKSGHCSGRNSKHINTRISWCAEQYLLGGVIFVWTPTELMVSDILSKSMGGTQFDLLNEKMCGRTPF